MPNIFHKNLSSSDIHELTAKIYANLTARNADIDWQNNENAQKMVKIAEPIEFYLLVEAGVVTSVTDSGGQAVFNATNTLLAGYEVTHVNFTEPSYNGTFTVTITDANTYQINLPYVSDDNGRYASWFSLGATQFDTLAEVLSNGNTSGASDIIMDAAQGIVIGGGARTTDTSLDVKEKKAIKLPELTTAERDALTPAEGMIIYNITVGDVESYNGTAWESTSGGDVVGPSSSVIGDIAVYDQTTGKHIGITAGVDASNVLANNTHRTSDGTDHTFIDQDLRTTASPQFIDPTTPQGAATKTYVDAIVNAAIRLQGDWNADTNTPDITGTTITGYAWRVSVAGSTNLGGITTWEVGDLAVKTDTSWLRINNQDIAAIWGNISGTLSNQTDLQSALDDKVDKNPTVDNRIIRADGAAGNIQGQAQWYIDDSGLMGYRISTPSAPLHLFQDGGNLIGIFAEGTTGGAGAIFRKSTSGKDLQLFAGTDGGDIYTSTGAYLAFHTNSATTSFPPVSNEKMRITPDGDVGINTTTPTAKINVEGDGDFNSEDAAWTFDAASSNRIGFVKKTGLTPFIAAGATTNITFGHSDATNLLTTAVTSQTLTPDVVIDPNGKVGFGTTTPSEILTISDPNTPRISVIDETNNVTTQIVSDDTTGFLGTQSAHPLAFFTGGGGASMLIDIAGNIGINTLTPGDKVEVVNGNIKLRSSASPFSSGIYSTNTTYLADNQYLDHGTGLYRASTTGSSHLFESVFNVGFKYFSAPSAIQDDPVTNTEIMRLHSSGGLAIGSGIVTTDPGAGNITVENLATIGQREAERLGNGTTAFHFASDLDPFTSGGTATLPSGTYYFKESMVLSVNIVIGTGATVFIYFNEGIPAQIEYTGTGTFISGIPSTLSIFNGKILCSGNGAKAFDLLGATFTLEKTRVSFSGTTSSIGDFTSCQCTIRNGTFDDFTTGATLHNSIISVISQMRMEPSLASPNTVWRFTGTSVLGAFIDAQVAIVGPIGSLFHFDASIAAPVNVQNVQQAGPGNFFEPATKSGAINGVTDLSATPLAVNSVTAAVFPETGTQFITAATENHIYVGDTVTHTGFTDANYNGVFTVTGKSGTAAYSIAAITFGATDTGTTTRNEDHVSLTVVNTTVLSGESINVTDTEFYDGGHIVVYADELSFPSGQFIVINDDFEGNATGFYSNGSQDETTKFVNVFNCGAQKDSKNQAFGLMNGNAVLTTIAVANTYQALDVTGIVRDPATELWVLIDAVAGIWRYEGLNAFSGALSANLTASKAGGTQIYRLTVSIDGAIPVFATANYSPIEVKATKVTAPLLIPVSINPGQTVQIMAAGEGTSDNLTFTDMQIEVINPS